jgi:hypothetical protein
MPRQFLFGVVLSGFVALGCETESSPSDTTTLGSPQVRVVAPDGRTFVGPFPASVEVYAAAPDGRPDRFTFVLRAGIAGDPTGHLYVAFNQPVDSMASPELIEAELKAARLPGDNGATAQNENGPISSGRLRIELRALRITGRVDTPEGAYQIDGRFSPLCHKQEGDHGVLDESHESPLCQRFAGLYP